MNREHMIHLLRGAYLPLLMLAAITLLGSIHPTPAHAANGECRWEGGSGAAGGHNYCKAEDCVGSGGFAQCTAAVGAPPSGFNDSEVGPDKWVYGVCGEWLPSIPLENRWCLAAGGTLVSYPTGYDCVGLPPTALHNNPTVTAQEPVIKQLTQSYTTVSFPNCPVSLASDTGWGATVEPISCAGGSTTYSMESPIRMLRRIQWSAGGTCNGATATFTATMFRDVKCPAGYTARTTPSGMQCYMPVECCESRVGNPVSTITGAKFQEEDDYRPNSAGGLRFSRYYKSSGYFRSPSLGVLPGPLDAMTLGDFWHHNYDSRLYLISGNAEVMAIQQRRWRAANVQHLRRRGSEYRRSCGTFSYRAWGRVRPDSGELGC